VTLSYPDLRDQVWRANQGLVRAGLVTLSFGNASGVDREAGVLVIKPSGVPYDQLRPEHLVVVSLDDGRVVERRSSAFVGHADASHPVSALPGDRWRRPHPFHGRDRLGAGGPIHPRTGHHPR